MVARWDKWLSPVSPENGRKRQGKPRTSKPQPGDGALTKAGSACTRFSDPSSCGILQTDGETSE